MNAVWFYGFYTVILLIVGLLVSNQMGASLERTAPNQPTSLESTK